MSYFDPKEYLGEYYAQVGSENRAILNFFARVAAELDASPRHLELGCGPTLYQIISLAPKVREIIYTDGYRESLNEVAMWLQKRPEAFDWSDSVRAALVAEGFRKVEEELITGRSSEMRRKLRSLQLLDMADLPAVARYIHERGPFGSISSVFSAEVAVKSHAGLRELFGVIYGGLPRGGRFNVVMVEGGVAYKVGNHYLPNLELSFDEGEAVLFAAGFKPSEVEGDFVRAERKDEGYRGVMMFSCLRG